MFLNDRASLVEVSQNLSQLLQRVVDDHQVIMIERQGEESVALISESDLNSLLETAYLLKSPANAQRLASALAWSQAGDNQP
jgi:antitoxin YefM